VHLVHVRSIEDQKLEQMGFFNNRCSFLLAIVIMFRWLIVKSKWNHLVELIGSCLFLSRLRRGI
jgi:hypothetical protein